MDISSALINTQSPDSSLRQQAEEVLTNALRTHMGQFLFSLVQALSAENYDIVGRQAAGLYLKNVLDAKDENLQKQKIQAWDAMEPQIREQIKHLALQTLLSTEQVARHTGAQVVAKIGVIELPRKQWPNLLETLLQNVTGGPEGTQRATLEALGYICDGLLYPDCLDQEDTNRILTAIVDGIRTDRADAIRHAAVTALRHSLEFVSENFSREQERNHIMQVVCEATQCNDIRVRTVAFECIAAIATQYYEYLSPYMGALYDISFKAIKSDQPEVGKQSIEFWSSICDVESALIEEAEYYRLEGQQAQEECRYYIKSVMPQLIPVVTETLKLQEEDQDDSTWNISTAGATCLSLIAQTVGNDCVDLTMQFITANIQSPDWRCKEAAIMAFSSILEGPSTDKIGPIINQAMGLLMSCMSDPNILVRDTTAWAIGRICDFHSPCISGEMLPPLMGLLVQGLSQEPRVAKLIAFAIHNLAKAFEESSTSAQLLVPYYTVLFDKLFETANRPDSLEYNLRGGAYEALSLLIQAGPDEAIQHISNRLPTIIQSLENTFVDQSSSPEEKGSLQGLLCGTILVTIQRLGNNILPFADSIMKCLLTVFQTRNSVADEEGYMASGALANAINGDFLRYMNHFHPILMNGLKNNDDSIVCSVAVGVVGDLCRALEGNMHPYCDEIVGSLLSSLKNNDLDRAVKPPLISCFGDIALAIEGQFDRYLDPVMQTLTEAALACRAVNADDEDLVDYMNNLRESILEAFTGIIQGLGASQKGALMQPYLRAIGEFLSCLAADMQTRTDAVTTSCVGLIGDLGSNLGPIVAELVVQDFVSQLLNECINSSSMNSKKIGEWANGIIKGIRK